MLPLIGPHGSEHNPNAHGDYCRMLRFAGNDTGELKDAIRRAITMSPTEQNPRMKAMRNRLRTHDSHAWVASFMSSLDHVATTTY
jgi:hypothetical protein